MKNNDSHKFELIASVLHDEEIDTKHETIGTDPDFTEAKKVYDLKAQVSQLRQLSPETEAWKKVQSQLSVKRAINWQRILSYAAVFFATALLSTVFNYYFLNKNASAGSEVFASINSPRGQITSLTLFDGTTVWLNSGSTLKYSNQFGISNRAVQLEGEALFEVKKDQNNPDDHQRPHANGLSVKKMMNSSRFIIIIT